jgi:UDP-glucuronate 4-epimerase
VEPKSVGDIIAGNSLSPAAPYRVVNIGNNNKAQLLDFIDEIEAAIGQPIERNYMEMQKGDVPATWANSELLKRLTGYKPQTSVKQGIGKFISWYRNYYNV